MRVTWIRGSNVHRGFDLLVVLPSGNHHKSFLKQNLKASTGRGSVPNPAECSKHAAEALPLSRVGIDR